MTQNSLSRTRLAQFQQMQTRMGDAQFEIAMTTHRAPAQLRYLAWGFSNLVNAAMAVASVFQTSTRGDLSLLDFELMALGYFMPMKDLIQIDADIVRLSDEQFSVLQKMSRAGLLDNPDLNHLLVQKYVRIIDDAEELIQRVHVVYRRHVIWR